MTQWRSHPRSSCEVMNILVRGYCRQKRSKMTYMNFVYGKPSVGSVDTNVAEIVYGLPVPDDDAHAVLPSIGAVTSGTPAQVLPLYKLLYSWLPALGSEVYMKLVPLL